MSLFPTDSEPWSGRRTLLVALLALLSVGVLYLFGTCVGVWFAGRAYGQTPHCGVERWLIKTMSDPDRHTVELTPILTTVDSLRSLPAPNVHHLQGRAATELHTFTVRAVLLGWKRETDSDLHLVLASPADTTHTMIAEIPTVACAATDIAPLYAGMLSARELALAKLGTPTAAYKHLPAHPVVRITGVAFFDFLHGQTGVAPNGIELHPVIALAFEGP